jgi:hypothetical protein
VQDPDVPNERVNYFLEVADRSAFLGIFNDGIRHSDILLPPGSIQAYNMTFPVYSNLNVPIETTSSTVVSYASFNRLCSSQLLVTRIASQIHYDSSDKYCFASW